MHVVYVACFFQAGNGISIFGLICMHSMGENHCDGLSLSLMAHAQLSQDGTTGSGSRQHGSSFKHAKCKVGTRHIGHVQEFWGCLVAASLRLKANPGYPRPCQAQLHFPRFSKDSCLKVRAETFSVGLPLPWAIDIPFFFHMSAATLCSQATLITGSILSKVKRRNNHA